LEYSAVLITASFHFDGVALGPLGILLELADLPGSLLSLFTLLFVAGAGTPHEGKNRNDAGHEWSFHVTPLWWILVVGNEK
jgi:hypothetical protein